MDTQIDTYDTEQPNGEADSKATANEATSAPQAGEAAVASEMGDGERVIQVAQADTVIPVPPEGTQRTIEVVPGEQFDFSFPEGSAEIILVDGNLVILVKGGGEIVLEGFAEHFAEIPPLNFAGETVVALDLLTQVSTAEQLAEIAPAAGAAAAANTGAAFLPYDPGSLPPGLTDLGPLGATSLAFTAPTPEFLVFPAEGGGAPPIEMKIPVVADLGEDCGVSFHELAGNYITEWLPHFGAITAAGAGIVDSPALKVGDFFVADTSNISENFNLAALGSLTQGNDILDGRLDDGPSVLVGDVFLRQDDGEANVDLHATVSGGFVGSTGGTIDVLSDVMEGGAGDDTLVGDIFLTAPDSNEVNLDLNVTNTDVAGTDNTFRAFNDVINGGAGNDLMIGDVGMVVGGSSTMSANIDVTNATLGAEGGQFNAFLDAMNGGAGNDTMVGDMLFFLGGSSTMNVNIDVSNTVLGGEGNQFFAFNDMMTGGAGDDFIVGDFAFVGGDYMSSPLDANIDVSNVVSSIGGIGGLDGGEGFFFGANGNSFQAFNDLLTTNDLNDTVVGDIFIDQIDVSNLDLNLNISNQVGGPPPDLHILQVDNGIDNGPEFGPGSFNSFRVFSDIIDGDLGNELLVGDIFLVKRTSSATDINISLTNQVYGNYNSFDAFNDVIRGQGGDDTIVGDILIDDTSGNKNLSISIDNYVEGSGNTFHAFEDILLGGGGDDVIVGDVFVDDSWVTGGFELKLAMGGEGGEINAFNDHLCGGDGNDLLIGDIYRTGGGEGYGGSEEAIVLTAALGMGEGYDDGAGRGDNYNSANVFNDTLDGGAGDDTLVGDVYAASVALTAQAGGGGRGEDFASSGGSGGSGGQGNELNAFNDQLDGGDGNDLLIGDVYGGGGGAILSLSAEAGNAGHAGFPDSGAGNGFGSGVGVGGTGGRNNFVNAFNDMLDGGAGNDTLIGDVFGGEGAAKISLLAEAGRGSQGGSADEGPDGGDNNLVNAFNDELDGGAGDDMLVGDVYAAGGGAIDLKAAAGLAGRGGAGSSASDGGDGGDGNMVNAFNDVLTGGLGEDTLVGDVYVEYGGKSQGGISLSALAGMGGEGGFGGTDGDFTNDFGSGSSGGNGGNDDTINAFNDTLNGGDGNDVLVGDVAIGGGMMVDGLAILGGGPAVSLTAMAGIGGVGAPGDDANGRAGYGGDNNLINAFNDVLTGGSGDDLLVGDVYSGGGYGAAISLKAAAGDAGALGIPGGSSSALVDAAPGGRGGDNNRVNAFNDVLTGGTGRDQLIGDVFVTYSALIGGAIALLADAGIGGKGGSSAYGKVGGDDNHTDAYKDTLDGGVGNDELTGDVRVMAGGTADGEITLAAAAGVGGLGGDGSSANGGGMGGGDNTVNAFNDVLTGGGGDDTLVGDVYVEYDTAAMGAVTLQAVAGNGGAGGNNAASGGSGSIGGLGGNDNTVNAFNDVLTGGTGDDRLVGDVYAAYGEFSGTIGTVELRAEAGVGGKDPGDGDGGDGGDGNMVSAFNDELSGGAGMDQLIGDVHMNYDGGGTGTVDLIAQAGASEDGVGGLNDSVNAFNDMLDGGDGDDLLVGDAYVGGGASINVTVEGADDATINAFQDTLLGGDGTDMLYGDFYDGDAFGGTTASLDISGGFTGRESLFADSMDGGGGDDFLAGGLGSDTMTGGAGADTFAWFADDLHDLGGGTPVDEITDFNSTANGDGENDVLDLTDLLDSLGFDPNTDDVNDWLNLNGDTMEVDQNGATGGANFEDMAVLDGFNGGGIITVDSMITDGNLIVPV